MKAGRVVWFAFVVAIVVAAIAANLDEVRDTFQQRLDLFLKRPLIIQIIAGFSVWLIFGMFVPFMVYSYLVEQPAEGPGGVCVNVHVPHVVAAGLACSADMGVAYGLDRKPEGSPQAAAEDVKARVHAPASGCRPPAARSGHGMRERGTGNGEREKRGGLLSPSPTRARPDISPYGYPYRSMSSWRRTILIDAYSPRSSR